MIRLAKWWWHWFGPYSPLTPIPAGVLVAVQIIAIHDAGALLGLWGAFL